MEPLNNLKNQTAEKFNLIKDNPYVKILSPQVHEVWVEGEVREIRWNSFGIDKVRIALAIGGHDKGHLGDDRNNFIIDAKQEKYTWKIPPGFVTNFGITRSDEAQIVFLMRQTTRFWENVFLLFREQIVKINFYILLPAKAELLYFKKRGHKWRRELDWRNI